MPATPRQAVIFDLGGVVIDWNPRYLYRRLFNGDEAAVEHFLANVCTADWNRQQDAVRRPHKLELIQAWARNFHEMIPRASDVAAPIPRR